MIKTDSNEKICQVVHSNAMSKVFNILALIKQLWSALFPSWDIHLVIESVECAVDGKI